MIHNLNLIFHHHHHHRRHRHGHRHLTITVVIATATATSPSPSSSSSSSSSYSWLLSRDSWLHHLNYLLSQAIFNSWKVAGKFLQNHLKNLFCQLFTARLLVACHKNIPIPFQHRATSTEFASFNFTAFHMPVDSFPPLATFPSASTGITLETWSQMKFSAQSVIGGTFNLYRFMLYWHMWGDGLPEAILTETHEWTDCMISWMWWYKWWTTWHRMTLTNSLVYSIRAHTHTQKWREWCLCSRIWDPNHTHMTWKFLIIDYLLQAFWHPMPSYFFGSYHFSNTWAC